MTTIVEVQGLTKHYKDVTAVDNVSFTLEENKIYGLLGRNGAGKTTVMHMLTAQTFATSGDIRIFGEHPYENSRILSRICFIKESQRYPDVFRVCDALAVAASMYPQWDAEFASDLLDRFSLPPKRNIKKLSRGMLSAVGIIIGLASRAPLTIFDEPYLGLDAVARQMFYDLLLEDYAEHPRTIVLSTHLIDEVSRMLEHVLVIDKGRLIINEDTETLRSYAFTLAGPAAKVEPFLEGRQVTRREPLGSYMTATVIGELSRADRGQAQADGLELLPVSLQQLIVELTHNHKEASSR
ncbi:ABC transporter ATP-binding protein [Paenibacillus sp. 1P07SE]|uniref:ABC transporter ATP-binding protein n=1 Tax=Paenibacillus sp. 1P07SE TaxID=3132209 RepID=UPI0039A46AE8